MKTLALLMLLFLPFLSRSEAISLSEDARISLLTCEPGDEIYSYFGHSAIRINDPKSGIDYVFNYGVFSFDMPNFAWRFTKGETDYMLAGQRMQSFIDSYVEEKRSVFEQVLNISSAERQSLFDALVNNARPENRVYRYRHFSDNCSTRVRDQFEKCVNHQLQYDTLQDTQLTYRQLIDQYVPVNSWNGLGIKVALGIPADKITTYSQKMFLPDYLSKDMATAKVVKDGASAPFVLPVATIYKADAPVHSFDWTSPDVVINLLLLVVAGLTFWEYKRRKRFVALDFVTFFSVGFAGILLSFLCFVSVLEATGGNLNLFWALPTHFFFAFLWLFPSLRSKLAWYLKGTAILVVLFLIAMPFLPQTFHGLVISICFILLLRTVMVFKPIR